MKARLDSFCLAALMTALLVATDSRAVPTAVSAPSAVVLSFYRGYVARFRSDHDPLLDLVLEGSPMVSASLMSELRSRLDDDVVPDDDYFLHSPHGVRPCYSVDVEMQRTATDEASVLVTLGARHTPPWQLAVLLARDANVWRIRRVTSTHVAPTHKAATRAISDC